MDITLPNHTPLPQQAAGRQSDTTKLLDFEEVETSSGDAEDGVVTQRDPGCFPQMTLNHAAFRTLQLQYCEDVFTPGSRILQTVGDNVHYYGLKVLHMR